MISIIKSLTSGLQESEDKFSPLAKLDQMPFGVLCLNSLEATNMSQNQHSAFQCPVAGLALTKGTIGMLCGFPLAQDELGPPSHQELHQSKHWLSTISSPKSLNLYILCPITGCVVLGTNSNPLKPQFLLLQSRDENISPLCLRKLM